MLLLLVFVHCSDKAGVKIRQNAPKLPTPLTFFYLTELKGTVEPCGCNSDPLGDIARTIETIDSRRSQSNAVHFIDGGSSLFPEPTIKPERKSQELLKADLVKDLYQNHLKPTAHGLGPLDLSGGPTLLDGPRMVQNIAPDSKLTTSPPAVIDHNGAKIGLFGLSSPTQFKEAPPTLLDPTKTAKKEVSALEAKGVDTIIVMAHMPFEEAKLLVRAVKGIDFMFVGQGSPELPEHTWPQAKEIGDTWLIQPASKGQILSRLDLYIPTPKEKYADAVGAGRAKTDSERLTKNIAEQENEIKTFKADPSSDAAFVAAKEKQLSEMKTRLEQLSKNPLLVPDGGNYFALDQIKISKGLDCDKDIVAKKKVFDSAAGKANVAAAQKTPIKKPTKGESGFIGIEECSYCHNEAVDFWNKTKHHLAWETLEQAGKQFDYECTGCHVTGWNKPGGSNMAFNEDLRDVQCEVCHGPGSIHAEASEAKKKSSIILSPKETRCIQCHNEEHSDTFDFKAYLRDVTGKGHGEAFRKKLGDGPTGLELRSAALKKAGLTLGAHCSK